MAVLPRELPLLTQRQMEALRAIRGYFLTRRYYPTQRELCELLGVRSTNARPYLDPLISKGYLEQSGAPRGIKFTPLALELFGAEEHGEHQQTLFT